MRTHSSVVPKYRWLAGRYTRDLTLAVVEAKADYKLPGDGLQQAKENAEILGFQFAYATNGLGIVELDYLTGQERALEAFPTPDELWTRLHQAQGMSATAAARLTTPSYLLGGWSPRYYQEIAINRVVQAILQGKPRVLLTMATGTGKTKVAFQIAWKLWTRNWNRAGSHRKPRMLFLADRSVLVDDPKDKDFAPFGDARWKIENGVAQLGREMYFALYQSLAGDSNQPGLYRRTRRPLDPHHPGPCLSRAPARHPVAWWAGTPDDALLAPCVSVCTLTAHGPHTAAPGTCRQTPHRQRTSWWTSKRQTRSITTRRARAGRRLDCDILHHIARGPLRATRLRAAMSA